LNRKLNNIFRKRGGKSGCGFVSEVIILKIELIIASVLLVLSLGCFVTAGVLYVQTKNFLKRAITTYGIVTKIVVEKSNTGKKSEYYFPIISYDLSGKQTIEFQDSFGSGNPNYYTVGQQVEILYDPQNPKEASVKRFLSLWLLPILFIIGGLITLSMSGPLLPALLAFVRRWGST